MISSDLCAFWFHQEMNLIDANRIIGILFIVKGVIFFLCFSYHRLVNGFQWLGYLQICESCRCSHRFYISSCDFTWDLRRSTATLYFSGPSSSATVTWFFTVLLTQSSHSVKTYFFTSEKLLKIARFMPRDKEL